MTRQAESRQLIYDGGWAGPETFLLNRALRRPKAPAAAAAQSGTEEGKKGEGEAGERKGRRGGRGRLVVCGKERRENEKEEWEGKRPVGAEDEAGGGNYEGRR